MSKVRLVLSFFFCNCNCSMLLFFVFDYYYQFVAAVFEMCFVGLLF